MEVLRRTGIPTVCDPRPAVRTGEGLRMSGRGSRVLDESVGDILRRFQARYEPVATKLLLLGIFVTGLTAQFVKPVGEALEGKAFLGGSLLSLIAYVLYDTVKDLAA